MMPTTAAFNESPLLRIGNAYVRAAAILSVKDAGKGELYIRLTDGPELSAQGTLRDFEETIRNMSQQEGGAAK